MPNHKGINNLSSDLGYIDSGYHISLKYIGPLSRFSKQHLKVKYDLLVILSGPIPQRTFLEEQLFEDLQF